MNNKIDRFLRRREVENLVGYSRSSIYQMISEGKFPKPIAFTPRSVRWRESDIAAWQQEKIRQSLAA